MRNAGLEEAQGGIKIAGRNINNLRYADDSTLMAESEEELKSLLIRQWHPTPVLFPGKSHGWRSLVGCSPWGRWGLDTTQRLHFHFSLSCIGEGNGNPLQCSCLENPRDGGAWWAAVYGVTQSRTRLKWLSSSRDETERGEWKSWLKAQHSESEDHGIWSHHFMGNRWGNSGNSVRL